MEGEESGGSLWGRPRKIFENIGANMCNLVHFVHQNRRIFHPNVNSGTEFTVSAV